MYEFRLDEQPFFSGNNPLQWKGDNPLFSWWYVKILCFRVMNPLFTTLNGCVESSAWKYFSKVKRFCRILTPLQTCFLLFPSQKYVLQVKATAFSPSYSVFINPSTLVSKAFLFWQQEGGVQIPPETLTSMNLFRHSLQHSAGIYFLFSLKCSSLRCWGTQSSKESRLIEKQRESVSFSINE